MRVRTITLMFLAVILAGCVSGRHDRDADSSKSGPPASRFGGAGSISSGSTSTAR